MLLRPVEAAGLQRVNFPNLLAVPSGWKKECPFYSKAKIRPLVENYLANKDTLCTRLGLCPKVPRWLKSRNIDWYERIEVENENLSLMPSFRDGKPMHLFYKFFVENISSMNLQQMVSWLVFASTGLTTELTKETSRHLGLTFLWSSCGSFRRRSATTTTRF